MRPLQRMENPRHHGPITCLCLDRKRTWLICGTSTGVLSLWDIRFGILIKSWKVGVPLKGKFGRVHQCVVHPTKGKGKWVVVAVETHKASSDTHTPSHALLEVWDIESTTLVESFTSRTVVSASDTVEEPKEVGVDEAEMSPAAAIAALVRARQENASGDASARGRTGFVGADALRQEAPLPPFPGRPRDGGWGGVRRAYGHAQVPHRGCRWEGVESVVVRKGVYRVRLEDCKLRFWDLGRPERSVILSGIETEGDRPAYRHAPYTLCIEPARLTLS